MKHRYYIIFPLLALSLAATITMALNRASRSSTPAPAQPVIKKGPAYTAEEKESIGRLMSVYQKLSGMQTYGVSGDIRFTDPVDSSRNMAVNFNYVRRGDSTYYQIGENRIIALPDIYISVDDGVKKIFLGAGATPPASPLGLPGDSVAMFMQSEGYKVQESKTEGITTFRLWLGNHASCKEYRISYDEQQHIRQVYARFTSLEDPLNPQMDKVMLISMRDWQEQQVSGKLLHAARYIVTSDNGTTASSLLSGYEVVMANN